MKTPPIPSVGALLGQIVDELRTQPRREIYITPDHEYYITYRGGGPFPRPLVESLVSGGALVEKYPGVPGCYVLA